MKYHWDKKYLYWGVSLFFAGCGCITFYYLLFKGADISVMWSRIIHILMPVLDGLAIAYILSYLLNFIEKKILKPIARKMKIKESVKSKKIIRYIGVFLTMIIFALILYSLIRLIVPQVITSIQTIIGNLSGYFDNVQEWLQKILKDYPELEKLFIEYWEDIVSWFNSQVIPGIQKTVSNISSSILDGVWGAMVWIWDFILGIIISIYLLSGKERFCAQLKKTIYAFLKEDTANTFLNNLRFSDKTFGGFLTGKIVDSIIIGILCYIGMSIFKFPYAILISVIIGVTNVIPFFGPYLGAIPSALLILMVSPIQCVYFLIFVLVLQQFDGNILGPKILGNSTGLSSFWVIFSITVFGGIFGVLGMFIGVPAFAVIYATFKTVVSQRLEKKRLPASTTFYMNGGEITHEGAPDHSGTSIRISRHEVKVLDADRTIKYKRNDVAPDFDDTDDEE